MLRGILISAVIYSVWEGERGEMRINGREEDEEDGCDE